MFPKVRHSGGAGGGGAGNAADVKGERNHLPAAENGWRKEHRAYRLALQGLEEREGGLQHYPTTACTVLLPVLASVQSCIQAAIPPVDRELYGGRVCPKPRARHKASTVLVE